MASTLPSAKELMEKAAQKEAEKAAEAMRLQAKAEDEKQALIDRLQKPSGVSDDEAMRRVKVIIERAVNNGLIQVQVYRFPNSLCTDRFLLTTAFNLFLTKPIVKGPVTAEGHWVSGKRRVFVADARLIDAEGEECARGTGTFMRSHIALAGLLGYRS